MCVCVCVCVPVATLSLALKVQVRWQNHWSSNCARLPAGCVLHKTDVQESAEQVSGVVYVLSAGSASSCGVSIDSCSSSMYVQYVCECLLFSRTGTCAFLVQPAITHVYTLAVEGGKAKNVSLPARALKKCFPSGPGACV